MNEIEIKKELADAIGIEPDINGKYFAHPQMQISVLDACIAINKFGIKVSNENADILRKAFSFSQP